MTEQEFYNRIPEYIQQDISRWNHVTLLAYFCNAYKQKYQIDFKFVRNKKGPTNGKEMKDFSKLFDLMAPENYKDLSSEEKNEIRPKIINKITNYINWMFQVKFRSGDRVLSGTHLFISPSILNEFEIAYNKWLKKNNNQDKFSQLISWCKEHLPDIFQQQQLYRLEDLKMIERIAVSKKLDSQSLEFILLNKAKDMGLI